MKSKQISIRKVFALLVGAPNHGKYNIFLKFKFFRNKTFCQQNRLNKQFGYNYKYFY